MRRLVLVLAVLALARPAAAGLETRVLVLPPEGIGPASMSRLNSQVADAMARGAAQTTPTVSRATASLADTAVIVGCDPEQPACIDAVAAALNVDQMLLARVEVDGNDASITVTAITRESQPVTRTFPVRAASRADDVAAIEHAVAEMLESGEAKRGTRPDAGVPDAGVPVVVDAGAPVAVDAAIEPSRPRWPLAVTVAGVALAAGGAVSWGLASSKQKSIDSAATATAADLDRLAALETSAKHYATAGNVLVVGGAAIAAAGVVLWWQLAPSTEVMVAPAVGADRVGLVVGGAW